MPAILANANDFALNSDYPVEKIVFLKTDSITMPFSAETLTNIPHEKNFTPLLGGSWSFTPDFSEEYDIGVPFGFSGVPLGYDYLYSCNVRSNSTGITFITQNVSGSDRTLYYRLWGLQPTDADVNIDPISSQGGDWLLNTDFNMPKVYASGITTDGYIQTELDFSIKVPRVLAWEERVGGIVLPLNNSLGRHFPIATGIILGKPGGSLIDNRIYFNDDLGPITNPVHYRIYI